MYKNTFIKILIFFFFSINNFTYADEIFDLTRIPNLKIYDLKSSNGIKYFVANKPFRLGTTKNIFCEKPEEKYLNKKFIKLKKNIELYPRQFLKKINLKYVIICQNLSISDIFTAGIANENTGSLIFDIKFNDKYFERVIHHEIFHIMDLKFLKKFTEEEWKSLNPSSFRYAECSTCTKKINLDVYDKTNGFITEYSKTTGAEDRAEIFSFLISYKNLINYKMKNDIILKKKIEKIKEFILNIDSNFKI